MPMENEASSGSSSTFADLIKISPETSDDILRQIRDKLDKLFFDTSVDHPFKDGDYEMQWWSPKHCSADYGNDKDYPSDSELRNMGARHIADGTVLTIRFDEGEPILCLPIGIVLYKGKECDFFIIWVLQKEEFWIVFNWYAVPDIHYPNTGVCSRRKGKFPGMEEEMSLAQLSDFPRKIGDFSVKGKTGFRVNMPYRVDEIIRAF